jgi:hypothetical protein
MAEFFFYAWQRFCSLPHREGDERVYPQLQCCAVEQAASSNNKPIERIKYKLFFIFLLFFTYYLYLCPRVSGTASDIITTFTHILL